MDISKKIKERRKELGLTMFEVAQKVGVSEATVSRWESGDIVNMRRDKVVSLAKALKTTPAFIMGWETVNIGYKLKEIRKEKNMSIHELSNITDITPHALLRYEKGDTNRIPLNLLIRIESALDLPTGYFARLNADISDFHSLNLTEHEEKVIGAYREQPEMQKAVDKLLNIE